MVKSKLLQYYADAWPNKVSNTPKLRTYVQFKTAYHTEEYIKLNLNRSERYIIAQFRCGVLPLRIETGRFVGEKPEEDYAPFVICECQKKIHIFGYIVHFTLEL